MSFKFEVDFDTDEIVEDLKNSVKKDLENEEFELDFDCPYCNKEIKNAKVKNNTIYECPYCHEDIQVDFDFSDF